LYLHCLEEYEREGKATVSSRALAERGGSTPAQVRKDLSFFGSFGRRGIGYPVPALAQRIRGILGLDRRWRLVLVGAGRLGAALVGYRGLAERGFDFVAAYDADPARIGTRIEELTVRDVADLDADLAAGGADIGVIGTPAEAAQAIADRLVRGGVRTVLNFASVKLVLPPEVTVTNVDMTLELETLSYALARRRSD
jgi:redox-sensing transcriptional repressor